MCVYLHTHMCACVYHIVQRTLYFSHLTLGLGDLSMLVRTGLPPFLIEERYRSKTENYSRPPSTRLPFPEAVSVTGVLYGLPSYTGHGEACYCVAAYVAWLAPRPSHWDSVSWRVSCAFRPGSSMALSYSVDIPSFPHRRCVGNIPLFRPFAENM